MAVERTDNVNRVMRKRFPLLTRERVFFCVRKFGKLKGSVRSWLREGLKGRRECRLLVGPQDLVRTFPPLTFSPSLELMGGVKVCRFQNAQRRKERPRRFRASGPIDLRVLAILIRLSQPSCKKVDR